MLKNLLVFWFFAFALQLIITVFQYKSSTTPNRIV